MEADSIYWDLGDGSVSSAQDLMHRYDSPGIYRICLYAVSSGGCIDSACTDLEQPPVESLFLPNCFTPNGDDRNEVFKAETVGIIELNVRIYNRWGRLIYEFNTTQGYWDGTTNGVPAQEAVYDYLLKARGIVSGDFERTGRVTLLR
jgi:gliding motility-associated-like protein